MGLSNRERPKSAVPASPNILTGVYFDVLKSLGFLSQYISVYQMKLHESLYFLQTYHNKFFGG